MGHQQYSINVSPTLPHPLLDEVTRPGVLPSLTCTPFIHPPGPASLSPSQKHTANSPLTGFQFLQLSQLCTLAYISPSAQRAFMEKLLFIFQDPTQVSLPPEGHFDFWLPEALHTPHLESSLLKAFATARLCLPFPTLL